jgi:hypothetical protein
MSIIVTYRELKTGDLIYFLPTPSVVIPSFAVKLQGKTTLLWGTSDSETNRQLSNMFLWIPERWQTSNMQYRYCMLNGNLRIFKYGKVIEKIIAELASKSQQAYNEFMSWNPSRALHIVKKDKHGFPSFDGTSIVKATEMSVDSSILNNAPKLDAFERVYWYEQVDEIISALKDQQKLEFPLKKFDAVERFTNILNDFKTANPLLFRKKRLSEILNDM